MSEDNQVTRELSLGEVVSRTFAIYRTYFVHYFVLFVIVETIVGVLDYAVRQAIVVPTGSTAVMSATLTSIFEIFILVFIITLVITPIATGSAIKMTSDEILTGDASIETSVRYAVSRLPSILAVEILTGIVVLLGLIAIIVPGIILAIMFSLAIPVVVVEKSGVFQSFGRSRQLVSHRWLKTFALAIVLGIIIAIIALILDAIGGLAGSASSIVSSILSAFYAPIIPIFLTVYYYSNAARINPPQTGPTTTTTMGPAPAMGTMTRFCPNCGAQVAANAAFCPNCGAKLTT